MPTQVEWKFTEPPTDRQVLCVVLVVDEKEITVSIPTLYNNAFYASLSGDEDFGYKIIAWAELPEIPEQEQQPIVSTSEPCCVGQVLVWYGCKETIWSWLSRIGRPATIAEIAEHFGQSGEDAIQDIIKNISFLGFVFKDVTLDNFVSNGLQITGNTIVYVGEYKG